MPMLNGPCPQCGKELQIPEELPEFSCLYCGARLTREHLLTDDAAALLQKLSQSLGPCVTAPKDTIRYLMPKKYQARYEEYLDDYAQPLAQLNHLPTVHHGALAEALLDDIDRWASESRHPDSRLEDAKYTLCLLFVPAAQQQAPLQGKPFCERFLKLWLKRHPKQVFQLTTYDSIAGGFDRKKLCFITTAVCAYQGKSDDCRELTAFRAFRDGWLSRQTDGQALIERYYAIAPGIVTAIDLTEPDAVYPQIWQDHLLPCLQAIDRGDNALCKARYTAMVTSLAQRYHMQ